MEKFQKVLQPVKASLSRDNRPAQKVPFSTRLLRFVDMIAFTSLKVKAKMPQPTEKADRESV